MSTLDLNTDKRLKSHFVGFSLFYIHVNSTALYHDVLYTTHLSVKPASQKSQQLPMYPCINTSLSFYLIFHHQSTESWVWTRLQAWMRQRLVPPTRRRRACSAPWDSCTRSSYLSWWPRWGTPILTLCAASSQTMRKGWVLRWLQSPSVPAELRTASLNLLI